MRRFHIDFYKNKKIYFTISLCFFAIGIIFNIIFGLKLDIQFKGGTLVTYSYTGDLNTSEVQSFIQDQLGGKPVDVQISESSGGGTVLNVSSTQTVTMDEQTALASALSTKYADNNLSQQTFNTLSPTMGNLFFMKCLVAIALASVLLCIYVAFRFRKLGGWSAGVTALVGLVHDMLVIYFTFVIFRITLNENFVAVMLTILGYSLNDTVIIYDRVRENRRVMGEKESIITIANDGINQTLTRSINTALCTFLSIAIVAVMALIYGLDSIVSFALPMMLGIISGCYSSICICCPLWVLWQRHSAKVELEKKKGQVKKVKA